MFHIETKSNDWVRYEAQCWVDIVYYETYFDYSSFERKNELVLLFSMIKTKQKVIFL